MQTSTKKLGFTLIELLVVVTIIGFLTALFVANMVSVRERAKDTNVKASLNELKTALRLYYNDTQNYPTSLSSDTLAVGSTVYMQEVPVFDSYESRSNGDSFLLSVELENTSDPDICASWSSCGVVGECTIGVDTTYYICAD